MLFFNRRALQLVIACVLWPAISAVAQTPSTPPASPPPTPAEAPSEPPSPAPAQPKGQRPQRVEAVEITGKNSATDERRNSSAAKIIITREDLEQYGDSNLGEAMRRLPGVSTGGRPGRPGAPTMRGMGGGFTQILLDGQRLPPGFSLEQITPDQVDRIEILRAPTAETGARAIAGTINIILREPLRQTNDEFKLGVQEERNKYSPNVSWTHNATIGEAGTYNLTASTTFTARRARPRRHIVR